MAAVIKSFSLTHYTYTFIHWEYIAGWLGTTVVVVEVKCTPSTALEEKVSGLHFY